MIRKVAGGIDLAWSSETGACYAIEWSTSYASWIAAGSEVASQGSETTINLADTFDEPYVVFRVRRLGPPPSTPEVSLALSGSPLAENGGVATVTAVLNAVSAQEVTVSLALTGTATSGSDYTASSLAIVIPAGSTTGTISIASIDDALGEGEETVIVDIDSVVNGSEGSPNQVTATIASDDILLEHLATWEMNVGTHRPEIFLLDSGELLVIVVEHEIQGEVLVTHKGYRFDTNFSPLMDPFVVTTETTEYGHPADHRAAVISGEVVVVYQALVIDPDAPGTGTPESRALNQSLLLARFDPETGAELDRQPLATNVTDFSLDNFPDHCLLWRNDRLLVSTGSRTEGPGGDHFRIREVDPFDDYPDNVLAVHDLTYSTNGLPSAIGNSFFETPDGSLWMFGSTGPHQTAQLQAAPLAAAFSPQAGIAFYDEEIEQTFPTGVVPKDDLIFVGSIYRARGGELDLETNPYFPRLKVFASDLATMLYDEAVGDGSDHGSGHVHPTIAIGEDRLYFAWSRSSSDLPPAPPQVLIEVYSLQR